MPGGEARAHQRWQVQCLPASPHSELESPAPGAVASDPEHLLKLEKQQQRTEKARAKGPSESSKKESAPRKEDHKASSRAEGNMSSEQEPVSGLGAVHYH